MSPIWNTVPDLFWLHWFHQSIPRPHCIGFFGQSTLNYFNHLGSSVRGLVCFWSLSDRSSKIQVCKVGFCVTQHDTKTCYRIYKTLQLEQFGGFCMLCMNAKTLSQFCGWLHPSCKLFMKTTLSLRTFFHFTFFLLKKNSRKVNKKETLKENYIKFTNLSSVLAHFVNN